MTPTKGAVVSAPRPVFGLFAAHCRAWLKPPHRARRGALRSRRSSRAVLCAAIRRNRELSGWVVAEDRKPQRRFENKGVTMADADCSHLAVVTTVKQAKRRECSECAKIDARWVHLRTCQTCGETLCCEDSPNRHASKHAQAAGHAVIGSAEPGERWLYCFVDDAFAEY